MAYGDISAVIGTLVFNPATTPYIDPIHIAGNVWLMCYQVGADNIQLSTIEIAPDGTITSPVIDWWLIHSGAGQTPRIIRVAGNIFAIADKTSGGVPTLTTFECLANGTLTTPIKDDWNWGMYSYGRHAWAKRTATLQTIAFMHAFSRGHLATLEIDSAGTITESLTDEVEFDADYASPFDSVEVATGIYALVYRGTGTTGVVLTFSVSPLGVISDPYVDKLTIATPGDALSICHVGGDVYAIAHVRSGSVPWLTTVDISSSGAIGASSLDDHQVLGFACGIPNVYPIGAGIVAYALKAADGDGWIYTFQIDTTTGAITGTPISSLEFDTTLCDEPAIFHIGGDVYGIAYKGPSDHGYLKTLGVSTPPPGGADHSLMMGTGP